MLPIRKRKPIPPAKLLLEGLIRNGELNRTDLRVGAYLVLKASFKNLRKFRQAAIGDALSVSPNHVGVSLKKLIKFGYVERDESEKSHKFRLLLPNKGRRLPK